MLKESNYKKLVELTRRKGIIPEQICRNYKKSSMRLLTEQEFQSALDYLEGLPDKLITAAVV